MTKDKLIDIIDKWIETNSYAGSLTLEGLPNTVTSELAATIMEAGPFVSDETMAKLQKALATNARHIHILDYYVSRPQRHYRQGFEAALRILDLLDAVKEQV